MAMKATTCELRDGYLGKWLTGEERIEFAAHLANCPDCRQIVQEQQRLECLLLRANAILLPVPAPLLARIDHRLRQARRRRAAAWATGLSAAGVLLGALATWFLAQRAPVKEPVRLPVMALSPSPPEPTRDPRSLVEVTFQPTSDVIAVPQQTENRSVTIIWVYPTIKTAQEPTPAPADLFQPPERNGI
jgi:hypothetical protein